MSDNYRHSDRLGETLRYLNNAMTNEERYLFEREMERDPFMQEAFEGLSGIRSSDIERDIHSIDLLSGKKRRSLLAVKIIAYAAGIALVVYLGYLGLHNIDFSKKQADKTTNDLENKLVNEPYKPLKKDSIRIDSTSMVDSSKVVTADERLSQPKTESGLPGKMNGNVSEKSQPLKADQANTKDLKKKLADKGAAEKTNSQKVQEPVTTAEVPKKAESESTAKPATNSEAQQQENEDNVAPENALRRPGVNAEPEPLGGTSLFKEYLENNVKYPGGIQNPKRELVKLKFKISRMGEPKDFFIDRSPGDAFSQEAIRLLKSGPKWSPEIKDGLPIEGEASVKVYFNKPKSK